MSTTTIYRADYTPPVFSVESVFLDFELHDDHAQITNRMVLRRERSGDLRLQGEGLELISLQIGELCLTQAQYRMEEGELVIPDCPDALILTTVTRIEPQNNTQLSGLYRSNQLFCTQCEAEGFRRMIFFPDRPDVMTLFTTRICADKSKYPVLLSNGNLEESGELSDGRHWVIWRDPFKKPSYLFALVAGDLACVTDQFTTCSGREVALKIYVEPGHEDQCAHAMRALKRSMRWDETEYGREYDLDIFMIVAVSDFNMGAMENKGLNIFNSKYILAREDTATDQDYADIEGVVAHEYFHNWTGNRVTCRDWFQLSLKEGLTVFRDQEFSRDMNSRDVNRIQDVSVLRNIQFPEDAGAMAHPVRPESYQEINNFYTATVYNKGAEVIRMQHTLLGKAEFRRGMDLYFERHDGQAVTIDEFVAAMEDANAVDLTQFKRWYSQAGTPEVTVSTAYEHGVLSVTLSQTCRPTPECQHKQPFHIPVAIALFDPETGQQVLRQQNLLELKEAEQTFRFEGLKGEPLVSLLRGFSAPITLKQSLNQTQWLALLRYETDGYAKWNAAQHLARECIIQFYHTPKASWQLSAELIEAWQHVLEDESLDAGLRAELLLAPGFNALAAGIDNLDVSQLEDAREAFEAELGRGLFAVAQQQYQRLWAQENHLMHATSYGPRKLRNVCLKLMMVGHEAQTLAFCQTQFTSAQTMTDQIASFSLLVNCSRADIRSQVIRDFYTQWSGHELVLDKWFAVQANSRHPDVLDAVKSLLTHPAFSLKNPNKVRALLGAFCQNNPRYFHAVDGSGYVFLADRLLELDAINPQISARLATPFTRGQLLDNPRRAQIKTQLERLAACQLSRDLNEMVVKSLANG